MARAATAVALALGLLLGAACGGNESAIAGMTAYEVVVGAATTTLDANTSKFSFVNTIAGLPNAGAPPEGVRITGTGAFDYDEHRGAMKITIPASSSTTTIDAVVIGTIVYQKLPPDLVGSTTFGTDKPWIKIDFATLGASDGINLGTLASAQSSDPSQAVLLLRGASTDVDVLGREKLRGDDVTHYRFTIDPEKATEAAPEGLKGALQRFDDLYGAAAISTEAWVDDDGRLRKLTYTLRRANFQFPVDPDDASAANVALTTTVELFDFGTEVEANAPPADQVADFNELLRGDAD